MTPGYFRPDRPTPQSEPGLGQELALVYTERFRRDLLELNSDLYTQAVWLVINLPDRHLNDPQRLMARDSRVVTLDDESGLRITYVIVLSLGELIVARVDYTRPAP
jgi:hypothetical protein